MYELVMQIRIIRKTSNIFKKNLIESKKKKHLTTNTMKRKGPRIHNAWCEYRSGVGQYYLIQELVEVLPVLLANIDCN